MACKVLSTKFFFSQDPKLKSLIKRRGISIMPSLGVDLVVWVWIQMNLQLLV